MPRETRIEMDWKYVPGQFDGIAVPVLLLAGSESTPGVSAATVAAAAAIPDAIVRVLAGQGHLAHRTDPELVANLIRGFVGPR